MNPDPQATRTYDGWNLIQEGASGVSPSRVYVHGGRTDEIVASWAGGNWNQHQYDAQGNCIMLTDIGGNILEQYDYDAFGYPYFYSSTGQQLTSSTTGNRFLFTGREWIKELRLYDYRNRMYQPELGRFLQPDPKQFAAGDYNLYRYCHNDPVNKTDPDGLVDLSYTPINQKEAVKWEQSYNPKGFFTIAGHANSHGQIIGANGKPVGATQIFKDMQAHGYKPGTPIIVVACNFGKGGTESQAAKLVATVAAATGKTTEVHASTTDTGAYRPGGLPVPLFQRGPDNQYDRSKPGEYEMFKVEVNDQTKH